LLEGCEQSAKKRGDMTFNQKRANEINEPDRPNAIDTLYDNEAVMPSVDLLRRHLKPFSDHKKYDSSWAASRDGMTREELTESEFAAEFYRLNGKADDSGSCARLSGHDRRCRGAVWVQIS
jgi:hypothetical protein